MEFTGERYIPKGAQDEIAIEHEQRYEFAKNLVKGKTVLDIACGEGYGSEVLSQCADFVYGVDISQEAITHASGKYVSPKLSFQVGSVDAIPLGNASVDTVVSFETVEHICEQEQHLFLKEAKRVLKPGGQLIMSTPNTEIYSEMFGQQNEFHVKEFTRQEYIDFLDTYFEFNEIYSQAFDVVSIIVDKTSDFSAEVKNDFSEQNAKYLISISSDKPLTKHASGSFRVNNFGDYYKRIRRILQLQGEVENLSQWGKNLDVEIARLGDVIADMSDTISATSDYQEICLQNQESKEQMELMEQQIAKLDTENEANKQRIETILQEHNQLKSEIQVLIEAENLLKSDIDDLMEDKFLLENSVQQLQKQHDVQNLKNAELSEQNICMVAEILNIETDLSNKVGHIELLLESERVLKHQINIIINSRGYKFLTVLYKMRDFVIPMKSKRRLALKLLKSLIKNPAKAVSFLKVSKIKNAFLTLKNYGADSIYKKIEIVENKDIQPKPIVLVEPQQCYDALVAPVFKNPLVSIIIPVYNQFSYTYNCIKSIIENSSGVAYEIIVADDVSTDETVGIENVIKNIRVVRNSQNLKFLLSCNNAAKHAKGKYIHFLNNDTNVQAGWLLTLVNLMENDNSVGMVGSKLVYPDGRLQEAGGILWNDASAWNYGNAQQADKSEFNYVKEVDYISGASIMVRGTLWGKIGGFDQRYAPAYCEDSDFAFEVRRAGYKVVYQPKSVVVHYEGISNGTDITSGLKAYQVENGLKFFDKWKDVLKEEHFKNGKNIFFARDRSRKKKTILVVDHYVPHHDKDAGSKCTFFYIKLFVSLGLNVKFIGDNFYRHEPYTSELEQMGVEVLYGAEYAQTWQGWIAENGKYFDYCYLNRPHISVKYIDIIKKHSKAKIIYFGHDLHYLREYRQYEVEKNSALLKSSNEWKVLEFELFDKADVVYVVGNYEQGVLQSEIKKPVRNIPVYMYDDSGKKQMASMRDRKDLLFVGGFGHTPNVDAVIWFAKHVFPKIASVHPQIKWYIVGSNPTIKIKELACDNIIVTGYVADQELTKLYAECRIVVAPLRFGAGVKGKVVEAIYNGVPLVTTTIGAEGLSQEENAMIVVNGADDTAKVINELYSDFDKLSKLSSNCKKFIENYFTVDVAKSVVMKDILV